MKLFGITLPFSAKRSSGSLSDDRWFTNSPYVYLDDVITINPESAMRFTAVFAAVKIISETLSSVPLPVYRRRPDGGKEKNYEHPLAKVLRKPNRYKTSGFELREMLTAHMLLWGNGYGQIIRNRAGEPLEILPIHPSRVTPTIDSQDTLVYKVRMPTGMDDKVLAAYDVFHLRGYRDSGLEGLSPISAAQQAIKSGLSLESFGTNFFEGGAFPAGLLEYPGEMSPEARKNVVDSWQKLHGGENRGKKVGLLEGGLTWKQMGIPQADAQFLEQRKFQVTEIARIFRIPPHMLGDLDRATFSNIEQQSIDFITYTMLPWFKRWEEALVRDFLDGDDSEVFPEFLLNGLLRGDAVSRSQAYAQGRQWGWFSTNDIRGFENLNPIGPEGDIYLSPLNMVPAGQEGQQDTKPAPTTEPAANSSDKKNAFRGIFKETWQRIIRKEIGAIKTAARKKSEVEFNQWLSEFLDDHRSFSEECLRAITQGYFEICEIDAGSGRALNEILTEYQQSIKRNVTQWRNNPEQGYLSDGEDKLCLCWSERILGYC